MQSALEQQFALGMQPVPQVRKPLLHEQLFGMPVQTPPSPQSGSEQQPWVAVQAPLQMPIIVIGHAQVPALQLWPLTVHSLLLQHADDAMH